MRRCLYILLILMLPLRGWVGDAMAMQMALPAAAAHAAMADRHAQTHADTDGGHTHMQAATAAVLTGAGDCAGHGGVNDPGNPDDVAHCGECSLCQTCHTVAVLRVAGIPDAGPQRPAMPRFAATGFTSADRALVLKPPAA